MRSVLRASILISIALIVPVLPFLLLGSSYEARVESWFQGDGLSDPIRFGLIVGVLATDVFLPVPSSMVSTYGGGVLGTWPAAMASWLGMTIGSVFGFGLARLFGRGFAIRLAGERDFDQMADVTARFGPTAILLTRALPILAEACVLLMGATRLSWRRFLLPVVVSNFVISLTYAAFGEFFQDRDALPFAILASGTLPLAFALIIRGRLIRADDGDEPSAE